MTKITLALLVAYAPLLLYVFFFQDKLLFFPDKRPFSDCSWIEQKGGQIVWDKKYNARYYFQEKPQAKATLVHFHGNAGGACDRIIILDKLDDQPINVALVEYPGYAGNTDQKGEKAFLENAESVLKSLKSQNPEVPFIHYGESLGTGIATYLASTQEVKGVILQSPYPSLGEVGQFHYPFLPVKLIIKNNFPLKKWAEKVKAPVLIMHGQNDDIIPYSLGQKASTFFKSPLRFETLKDRGHNDLLDHDKMWSVVKSFLKDVL